MVLALAVKVKLSLSAKSSLEFVALSTHVYETLYGKNKVVDIKDKYVALQLKGSNLLIEPQIYPVTIKPNLTDNTVELESLKYLQKYASEFTIECAEVSRISKIPALSHIVIGFPPEVYEILKGKSAEYLHKILCKERDAKVEENVIMRKGDICHILNGEIISVEPHDQGFLDPKTNITLVKHSQIPGFHTYSEINEENGFDDSELFGVDVLSNSIILNNIETASPTYSVKPLRNGYLEKFTQFDAYSNEFPMEDENLFACLSFKAFEKLRCLSGDMLIIEHENKPVYVRVFPFIGPSNFDDNSIYLSPFLIIALRNPKSVFIKWMDSTHQRADVPRYKLTRYIPLIKEITLARVSTTITNDKSMQHLFLANLKSYFEMSHRVVMKGQLIPIPLDSSLAKSIHSTYSNKGWYPEVIPDGKFDSVAWFIVTDGTCKGANGEIVPIEENKQYFVNSQKTRMLQSGILNHDLMGVDTASVKEYLQIRQNFAFQNISLHGSPGNVTFKYALSLRKLFRTNIETSGKINVQTTILLKSNTRYVGKSTVVRTICEEFGFSLYEINSYDLLNKGMGLPGATIGILRGKLDRLVETCKRLVIFIKHVESVCKKGDEQQPSQKSSEDSLSLSIIQLLDEYTKQGVIFIASSNSPDDINDILRSKIKFEIDVTVPSDPERQEIFKYLVNFGSKNGAEMITTSRDEKYQYIASDDVSIETLSLQSAALTPNDLLYVVHHVKLSAVNRLKEEKEKNGFLIKDLIKLNGGYVKLTNKDFEESINKARSKFSDSIGAPRIPNVKWEDVGGLDVVKNEILDTIEMPLKHPELFGSGMKKRSGLLFYGPPGTGKTLLAKAIATNFSLNFFSVKGPELLNMYIGESEANVRRVFEKARDAKPCVIFFDELDSVAPRRGNQGDSGGVMDRIVSQLLAELDGMSGTDGGDGVFVVGASNRPDLLDEALLRPGRFDKMLYLGISDTHEKQAKIIEALTRKFKLDPKINLQKIAETCPFNFTGADFYALCSDAMLNAMIRTAGEVDKKLNLYNEGVSDNEKLNTRQWFAKFATDADLDVVVGDIDFQLARADLVASVSEEELNHYLNVKRNFEGVK